MDGAEEKEESGRLKVGSLRDRNANQSSVTFSQYSLARMNLSLRSPCLYFWNARITVCSTTPVSEWCSIKLRASPCQENTRRTGLQFPVQVIILISF